MKNESYRIPISPTNTTETTLEQWANDLFRKIYMKDQEK